MKRVGVDENGLGAQLGPLIVTAVVADVTDQGARFLEKKLPESLRRDLDDSKALVSCHDVSLGEAWARTVDGGLSARPAKNPAQLLRRIVRESEASLRKDCPRQNEAQCWSTRRERFVATDAQLTRLQKHLETLRQRGVALRSARTEVICSARLNALRRNGIHRFTADLHAMERLLLDIRRREKAPLLAVCGKVGGIGQYGRFFGPLSHRLHSTLCESRGQSIYHFPRLGEVRFVRNADAIDPLVMLASLVGKYVRELLMARVSRFYPDAIAATPPSGYHDPITARFIEASAQRRRKLEVVSDCFLRSGEERPGPVTADANQGAEGDSNQEAADAPAQTLLFHH